MQMASLRLYGLSLLSALAMSLPFPFAGPVPAWRRLFAWFCLVPLLSALLGTSAQKHPFSVKQCCLAGYLCGVAWFGCNCYWIFKTMYLYGGLPAPAAAGVLVLFSLYLGLYFGLAAGLLALVRLWKGRSAALLLFPFLWTAVELARDRITGFPWDLLGYTQIDLPLLTQLAPWTGVLGISLVLAAGNALCFWQPAIRGKRYRWAGPVCTLLVAILSWAGMHPAHPPAPESALATLVQDNYEVGSPELYRTPEPAMLATLDDLSLHPQLTPATTAFLHRESALGAPAGGTNLVLWPEAPTPFESNDPAFRQSMAALAKILHSPVIVQADAEQPASGPGGHRSDFVAAAFFLPDGSYAGHYDKMHLVPFGEYTPYKRLFFFAGHLLDQLNFVPGTTRRLFSADGHRYGTFLCYESIFGDEVRQFTLHGAQVLVNLSDDGWYGDTSAPWEHLDMTRMRAIENHRWVLLDTNTGTTASIDPDGRIVASMPRHTRGAVLVPFNYRNDLTFYTRHGDWIGWLSAILTVSVLAGGYLQRRYPYAPTPVDNKVN